jgi:DNA-binding MurR/RpiR family transcriptional regulator
MTDQGQFGRLRRAIHSKTHSLTPLERKIASYILEQTQEVAMISVQELAQRLETGPATIMRVVRKLGYRGLTALKNEIKQEIRTGISPLVHYKSTLNHGLEAGLTEIRHIAEQEVANINESLTLLNQKSFSDAVSHIVHARHVYTIGVGISSHLASTSAFLLRKIGIQADAVPQTGLQPTENIVSLEKGDLLIAFSFPPYSRQTIEATAMAKKQKVSIVGITNQLLAPITAYCDTVLVAKSESRTPSNSLSAPLLIMSGLVSATATKTRPHSLKVLETAIKLRKKPQHKGRIVF